MGLLGQTEKRVGAYEVRIADPGEDRSQIASVLWPYATSREWHKEMGGPIFDDASQLWAIVYSGSSVVGFGAIRRAPHAVVWLDYCYIVPDHRRNGLYRAMLEARLGKCNELNAKSVRVVTRREQVASLLKSHGFEVSSVRGQWTYYEKVLNG